MTKEEMTVAVDMAVKASSQIHELQVQALRDVYEKKSVEKKAENGA
jgi:hypothetical protein